MKKIRNFENYEISTNGIITNNGNEIKQCHDKDGYLCIMLYNNGKRRNMKVHRILYDTFISELSENDIVDHIDMNRTNNELSNLRIISKRDNCVNNKKRKEYYAINIDTCKVYIFDNPNLFQEKFNFTNGKIRELHNQICHNFIIGKNETPIFKNDELNYVNELDYERAIKLIYEIEKEIDYDNIQIKKHTIKKCIYSNGTIDYFRSISEFCSNSKGYFVERNVRYAVANNTIYKKCTFSKIGLFNIKSFDEVPTTIENYRLLNQLKIRYENTRSE